MYVIRVVAEKMYGVHELRNLSFMLVGVLVGYAPMVQFKRSPHELRGAAQCDDPLIHHSTLEGIVSTTSADCIIDGMACYLDYRT